MLIKFLKIVLVLIILSLLSAVGAFFYTKSYLQETIKTPKTIYIPKGSTKAAMKSLQKSGLDINDLDYYLVKLIGYPQAGWIDLGANSMTRSEFFAKITHSKAALIDIVLIPGETKEIFFTQVANELDLNATKLANFYRKYTDIEDGVILAETYHVPKGITEDKLIKYLIDKSLKLHKSISEKELKKYNQKEWFSKYITIASIIQKEAANKKEMPLVSAVIYNRLKKKMKLQMDGTLNYGKYSHIKVTPKRIKEDNSSYNTYKIAALPPNPVCAVSIDAIKAALHPADVNYLYFVKGKGNSHKFTTTYKDHLKEIRK